MKCPKCGKKTRVMESRPREGGVWRRRKCAGGHLSYTIEDFCDGVPRKRKPRAAKPKKEKPLYSPALRQWNLEVTKDSPLWLKNIAMQLDGR
jgi:hypothetical protein